MGDNVVVVGEGNLDNRNYIVVVAAVEDSHRSCHMGEDVVGDSCSLAEEEGRVLDMVAYCSYNNYYIVQTLGVHS